MQGKPLFSQPLWGRFCAEPRQLGLGGQEPVGAHDLFCPRLGSAGAVKRGRRSRSPSAHLPACLGQGLPHLPVLGRAQGCPQAARGGGAPARLPAGALPGPPARGERGRGRVPALTARDLRGAEAERQLQAQHQHGQPRRRRLRERVPAAAWAHSMMHLPPAKGIGSGAAAAQHRPGPAPVAVRQGPAARTPRGRRAGSPRRPSPAAAPHLRSARLRGAASLPPDRPPAPGEPRCRRLCSSPGCWGGRGRARAHTHTQAQNKHTS